MLQVTDKTYPPFKDYLFDFFVAWEKKQPKKRSSYTAFARWLSDNSYAVLIKQQMVSDWIHGKYKADDERYLLVLAEKVGDEIYEVLNKQRPNPFLQRIIKRFPNIPPDKQRQLAEDSERFEAENARSKNISAKRKTSPRK